MANGTKTKECSCGINNNYTLEPLPKLNSNMIGVMTPRFALGGDILQASLTIIPAAAQNGLRGKTLSRHSVSNVLESEPQWEGFREIYVPGNGGTLPTRHSKSLDQLETPNLIVNSLPRQNTLNHQQINLITKPQPPALTYYQPLHQHTKKNATAEDLLKNINEFKEKYKNPCSESTKTLAQLTNDVHPKKLTNGPLTHQSQPTTIFPKQIHVNSNNVLTLNRVTLGSNNPKTDYVHELKQNNNQNAMGNNQHGPYYNSLPKHAGMGIPPRNSFPPIRGKKNGKLSHPKSPKATNKSNLNTIPRSNSSQALRQQNGSRNRVNDSKKGAKQNGKYTNGNESSSTDQSTTITPKRRSKRLLSSRSVPFKLELLELEQNGPPVFSESLPNLAPPPPAFSNSPPLSMKSRNRTSSSESTSSLSEQSGWVSSHRSSLPSSPETLKNEQRAFNGEQLRKKLLKLLEDQPQRKGSIEKKQRANVGRTVNGFSQHKRHSSGNAIERNKSLTFNGKSSTAWENLHNEWVEMPQKQPINEKDEKAVVLERQMTLDSKSKKTRKTSEKSKSDFDLTSLPMDQPFEDLRLPPPQQFRDIAPLPPDEFRDPPPINEEVKTTKVEKKSPVLKVKQQKPHQPLIQQQSNPVQTQQQLSNSVQTMQQALSIQPQIVEAIDNPLYHIYEIKRQPGPARPFIKSQSNNELIGMVRAASVNDKMISQTHHTHLKNLSKPSSPAQSSDRSDSETKKEPPVMLMEFEKCREEFRKQINYSGSIYSDFTKLASEMPYFHISDEYRTFSPGGVHLIVCVHGLDGNSADLRLVRTYLELGLPGSHLEFL